MLRNSLDIKKFAAWLFWFINLVAIIAFWLYGPAGQEIASGSPILVVTAFARLFGFLAVFCALTQFMLMGRVGWLEPLFGMDKLAIFHRRNGIATLLLILLHVSTMLYAQTQLRTGSTGDAIVNTLELPNVIWAALGVALFVAAVTMSLYIVRKHMRFEIWYAVHLTLYLAIVLVALHQFAIGSSLQLNQWFWYYWLGLYLFTAVHLLVWRFGKVSWLFARHRFKVQNVVSESASATSVYITGKRMNKFTALGGQFVLVRFIDKHRVLQEHPFSLSRLPDGNTIRLTIRHIGDFTNTVADIKTGTYVLVSGPFGAFTHRLQRRKKVLYIAGGIGITPIRSLIQERQEAGKHGDAALLYANRTLNDTVLWNELTTYATKMSMPIYNILSGQPGYKGHTGYITQEKIKELVPDVAERDVFLCGPPPMMAQVKAALNQLHVPDKQLHYERFSLHKD